MKWISASVSDPTAARLHRPGHGSRLLLAAAGWIIGGCLLAEAAGTSDVKQASAASTNKPPKRKDIPEEFPQVNLSGKSQPRYVAIDLDSLKTQAAYLLFDGDVTNGYERMYIWSPGHPKFGKKPMVYRIEKETQSYTSITTESEVGKIGAETKWTIKYQPEMHGHSYTDYKTGKLIQQAATLVPCFYFEVDLKRGPARRIERKGGKYPLDVGIKGRLYVTDKWENMLPTEAPWTKVYCSISRVPNYDKRRSFLRCQGHLQYHHDRWNSFPCTVRALPDDTRVHLEIAPYLEKPIYERNLRDEEIFIKPADIDVPHGWYRIMFTFTNEFFKADGLGQNSDSWPFAFPPPSD
jgi:hypothetical protein